MNKFFIVLITLTVCVIIFTLIDIYSDSNYQLWLGEDTSRQAGILNHIIENPADSIVVRGFDSPYPIGIIRFEPAD